MMAEGTTTPHLTEEGSWCVAHCSTCARGSDIRELRHCRELLYHTFLSICPSVDNCVSVEFYKCLYRKSNNT